MRRKMTLALAVLMALGVMAGPALALATGSIGNDAGDDREFVDDSWTNWWIVDTNNPADIDGTIEQIDYWARTTNDLQFFLVDDEEKLHWLSDPVTPEAPGAQSYELPEAVGVSKGYNLGVYYPATGVVSYDSGGTTELDDRNNSGLPADGEVGEELNFTGERDRVYAMGATIIPADPETKDACKAGGWEEFDFRNQGQCVRYVNTDKDSR